MLSICAGNASLSLTPEPALFLPLPVPKVSLAPNATMFTVAANAGLQFNARVSAKNKYALPTLFPGDWLIRRSPHFLPEPKLRLISAFCKPGGPREAASFGAQAQAAASSAPDRALFSFPHAGFLI
jgi:hypothetical protein